MNKLNINNKDHSNFINILRNNYKKYKHLSKYYVVENGELVLKTHEHE